LSARDVKAQTAGVNVGTLIRFVTIPLGILSALGLARDGFGFKLFPFLDAIITAYGIVLDDLFLDFVLAIFEPIFNALNQWFGWSWTLFPHWKHGFVLLWLFLATEHRAYVPPSFVWGREGIWSAVDAIVRWFWVALSALLGALLAGTIPLDHSAVFWWPVAMYFLYWSGDYFLMSLVAMAARSAGVHRFLALGAPDLGFAAIVAMFALGWIEPPVIDDGAPLFWWAVVVFFLSVGIRRHNIAVWGSADLGLERGWRLKDVVPFVFAAAASAAALGLIPEPEWLAFRGSPSPGLSNLIAFFVVLSSWSLLVAILWDRRRVGSLLVRVLASRHAQIALDVFTVLGVAAIIVYLSQLVA